MIHIHSRETITKNILSPFWKGSAVKGKSLLPFRFFLYISIIIIIIIIIIIFRKKKQKKTLLFQKRSKHENQ